MLRSAARPDADAALGRLLAAASAPARPHELRGEEEALRSFQLAHRAHRDLLAGTGEPAPARQRRSPRLRWGWALVAKLAALVLATAGAGWALAASAGVVPAPWEEAPVAPASMTAPAPGRVPTSGSGGPPGSSPAARPTTAPGPSPAEPGAALPTPGARQPSSTGVAPSPDPALYGLCRAFVERGADPADLRTPAFERLVAAAGGASEVPAYCAALLDQAGSDPGHR